MSKSNNKVDIASLYDVMFKNMGPQGWWPADSKLEIIIGAILVQNTNWRNVDKSLANLKKATAFNAEQILALPQEELQVLVHPSGFYKNKAKAVMNTFKFFHGYDWNYEEISKIYGDNLRKKLLSIPGIGPETADVYLLFIFDRNVFIADKYARVLFKYLEGNDYPTYQNLKRIVKLPDNFTYLDAQELHGLIDDFGKVNLRNNTIFNQSFLGQQKDDVLKN